MILEWLAASDNIKNTRRIWGTAQKFAKVFAVANSVTVTSVLGILRPANMQVLRSARIRLDVVACNLFRKVWSELVPDTINIYLYLDSSPQVRGEELFALSIELRDPAGNYPWERRLAPMIAIQKDYFDAVGKSLALVYLIWLLVGPTASQVIRFCDRVRGIVTDMGTERKIARSPCLISDYFDLMLDAPVQIPFRLYLFPLAVSSPGWMHGWDVVMQRSLASLSFFPSFLIGLKSVIAFFRSKLWKSQLTRDLKTKKLAAAAEVIQGVSMPSIAEWRWGTLWEACRSLQAVLGTIQHYFSLAVFGDPKTINKTLTLCSNTLKCPDWTWQFQYVAWFCDWICSLQSWGRGSKYHDNAKGDAGDVDPLWRGRRLGEAEEFVKQSLQQGLSACNSWSVEYFGCGHSSLLELQRCTRSAFHLAQLRHDYLSKLPWILVHLLKPGGKSRCVRAYESCSGHHPLSDRFFAADGPLRPHVDALDDMGGAHLRD